MRSLLLTLVFPLLVLSGCGSDNPTSPPTPTPTPVSNPYSGAWQVDIDWQEGGHNLSDAEDVPTVVTQNGSSLTVVFDVAAANQPFDAINTSGQIDDAGVFYLDGVVQGVDDHGMTWTQELRVDATMTNLAHFEGAITDRISLGDGSGASEVWMTVPGTIRGDKIS